LNVRHSSLPKGGYTKIFYEKKGKEEGTRKQNPECRTILPVTRGLSRPGETCIRVTKGGASPGISLGKEKEDKLPAAEFTKNSFFNCTFFTEIRPSGRATHQKRRKKN